MKTRLFAILLFLFCTNILFGQTKDSLIDSHNLNEYKISAPNQTWRRSQSEAVDTLLLQQYAAGTLANILQKAQSVQVKSYGNSGLATISYRGLDPSALNLIWNGVKLNSSFNGQSDLSLIPSFLIDGANFYSNTSTSNTTSGSTGADLVLSTFDKTGKTPGSTNISFQTGVGSFNSYHAGLSLNVFDSLNFVYLKAFRSYSKNDFKYQPIDFSRTGEFKKTENAQFLNQGINFGFRLGRRVNQATEIHMWVTRTNRKIPATILEGRSDKRQFDESFIYVLNKEHPLKFGHLKSLNSINFSGQNYNDHISNIENTLVRQTLQNALQYSVPIFKKIKFNSELRSEWLKAETGNYDTLKTRWILSQNTSLKWVEKKWNLHLGFRSLFRKPNQKSFLPYFSIRNKIGQKTSCHLAVETNSRQATFNELYWVPGGDSQLADVESIKNEIGFNYEDRKWGVEQVFFYHEIKNNIQWLPGDLGYFTAVQTKEFSSFGSETALKLNMTLGSLKTSHRLGYNFTKAYSQQGIHFDASQQIFIPVHSAVFSSRINWQKITLAYYHQLVSKRFVDDVNEESIAAYHVGDLNLSYNSKYYQVLVGIQNLWDANYYVLPYRPMPFRNYNLTIKYKPQFNYKRNE